MAETPTFSFEEQVECMKCLIEFQKNVIQIFGDEDADEVKKAERDLALMKAIQKTLVFEAALEQRSREIERYERREHSNAKAII